MTVKELKAYLEEWMAPTVPEEWDNDGIMVSGDTAARVSRVLLTLDITDGAVEYAVGNGFDTVLSHHPMIFSKLSSVTDEAPVSRRVLRLLRAGVSALSYHTRLDAAHGGVNDVLASLIGLENVRPAGEGELAIPRVGTVTDTSAADFASRVKAALGAPFVLYADGGKPIRQVFLVGGEGKDFLPAAQRAGADLFLAGRIGYHSLTDAAMGGMTVMEAGHYFTEAPVLGALAGLLKLADSNIYCEVFSSNVIQVG